jgi:hypothetical protein
VAPAPWRLLEPETFAATVLAAADQLEVQPLAVEKDYWVCEALRAIQARFPEAIIFKGGTSLEKLRLVQRFSEDLDLLVVGQIGGATATKTARRNMCEIAAEAVGGGLSDPRSGGNPGGFHRRAYLHPPLENHAAPESTVADPAAVLLELGQSGGAHPASTHEITSLLSRQLAEVGFDIERYQDLRPVTVQVLHPGRTLLEKLLRVNNFTKTFDDGAGGGWFRCQSRLRSRGPLECPAPC